MGGVAVINTQSYSTVEDIIIRVTDDFGREAFSSVIAMDSGGLYFAVTIPDTAVVGPPSTFPLVVELLDSNTGERVMTQDRLFNITVMSAQTGLVGTGAVGVAQGILAGGMQTIYQAYSTAEEIFVQVADTTGITGISNTCLVLADGFKRIQLVAPGESAVPGAMTGDGKDGDPLTQQAEAPFTLTVRAVDQYWNLADDVVDGAITLSSSGGQLDLVDPADAGVPFINGSRDIEVVLGNPGVVAVFATDAAHGSVSSGRVDIPVNEADYEIILPDPATVTAGPPSTFTLTVRLVNPETGERIDAGGAFEMTALLPDRSGAHGTLGIETGTLVGGEAVISGQNYAISEQIVVRVRDDRGRESFSDPLTVVPEGVRYAIVAPDTVIAGLPFEMSVQRIDIVTGQLVTSDDRNFTLTAFSGNSPRPDWGLNPAGVLADSVGTTSDGIRTFFSQSYDRAETIYLRVTDGSGELAYSDVIVVLPAPAAVVWSSGSRIFPAMSWITPCGPTMRSWSICGPPTRPATPCAACPCRSRCSKATADWAAPRPRYSPWSRTSPAGAAWSLRSMSSGPGTSACRPSAASCFRPRSCWRSSDRRPRPWPSTRSGPCSVTATT